MTSGRAFVLSSLAALSWLGCGSVEGTGDSAESNEGVARTESEIIGGSTITVATRRSLGLIDVNSSCSGGLVNNDWVATASHCINWGNVPAMTFRAPRTDGGTDPRSGSYAVQVGATDIALVRLGAPQVGHMWPSVSHAVTTSAASSFVGQNITCYGQGHTQYDADGAGVNGFGTWKTLTKNVLELIPNATYGEKYRTTAAAGGQQVLSWGDSGSNCYNSSGQLVAVHSGGNCSNWQGMGQPGDTGCQQFNVIAQLDNFISATASHRSYMTEALSRSGTTFEPLSLINAWQPGAYGANGAGAAKVNGIVTLRGGISGGTAQKPFTLPAAYRPDARVYVPTSTTNDSIGRLVIETNGDVNIECEGGGGFCQNSSFFTSLDGVSFAQNTTGATSLTPLNGWATAPYGNRAPAVRIVNTQVHFIGAISTSGTNTTAFQLPPGFRPSAPVWVPVGLCNSAKGRLNIGTDGNVSIQVENGVWSAAQCFVSLEGASFPLSSTTGTTVALTNGWVSSAFGSGHVRFWNDNGVVRFKGAASGGTAAKILTLPVAFRPATTAWIWVDTFQGKRGRIMVQPDGSVSVDPPSLLSNAQGFISFDGAEFGI